MSKVDIEEIKGYIKDICDKMVEDGYDFSQGTMIIKRDVKEAFTQQYGKSILPIPKLIPLIAKTVPDYIIKPEDEEQKQEQKQEQEQEQENESNQLPKRKQQNKITVEDLVENIKKHDISLKSTTIPSTTAKSSSYVEFCDSQLIGVGIRIGDNEYEAIPKSSAQKDFCKDYKDIDQAEIELIEFVLGSERSEPYFEAVQKYNEAIQKLRKKYPIKTGKKIQKFKYVKKDSKVKFINPDTNKEDVLPENEAKPIVEFNKELIKFEKEWKQGISSKDFNLYEYLKLNVIKTQNIIKFEKLITLFPNIFAENTSKITNTVLSTDKDGNYMNVGNEIVLNKLVSESKFVPDYMQLFSDLKNFNGTQFQRVVKNIYTHRSGIVLHHRCTHEFKKKRWLQAYANICAIDLNKIDDENDKLIISAWKNILSSRFAYYVILCCVPESTLFNKAMFKLIQEGTTIKLLQSVLYPISFAFTPFMLGYNNFYPKQIIKVTKQKYKDMLLHTFLDFGSPDVKFYDYEDCQWIYYANKEGTSNQMINLLHNVVKEISNVPTKSSNKSQLLTEDDEEENEDE